MQNELEKENDSKKEENIEQNQSSVSDTESKEDKVEQEQVDLSKSDGKRKSLFHRLLNRRVQKETPEITKGKKNEYIHSNFQRKKEDEPNPETFPKKKRILSWQEEELLLSQGNNEADLELAEELEELSKMKD